jgi:hypothetical protein
MESPVVRPKQRFKIIAQYATDLYSEPLGKVCDDISDLRWMNRTLPFNCPLLLQYRVYKSDLRTVFGYTSV